jgi:hypothetical protein
MSPGLSYDSDHSPKFKTPYYRFLELSQPFSMEHLVCPSLLEWIDVGPLDDQD